MYLAATTRLIGCTALLAALAGCSAKLSEADIHQALARIDQASQQQDVAVFEQLLAPTATVKIDMRAADIDQPLELNKSQYLQLLKASWQVAGSDYRYARSNTRISFMPGGKVATASATIQETVKQDGQTVTSTMDEVSTFALLDGKLQVTSVQGVLLSMQ